jgi:hypothetical protein
VKYTIITAYKDFFAFLDKRGDNYWNDFQKYYIHKYRDFFQIYFRCFTYSKTALRERVKKTFPEHYAQIKSLILAQPPEDIVERTIKKCIHIVNPPQPVTIYIFIGFFSAEGFTMNVNGKPTIGISLERMRDFSKIDIITAHEYGHYIRNLYYKGTNQYNKTINEGVATYFSKMVIPTKSLPRHLFMTNGEFNRLLNKRDELLHNFKRGKLDKLFNNNQENRRIKNFIGYIYITNRINRKNDLTTEQIFKTRF